MGWNNQNNFTLLIVNAGGGFTGLFVYSPVPGAGNLIESHTGSAGTDPYGNAYLKGDTSYSASGVTNENGGVILSYAPAAAAGNLIASTAPAAGTDTFGNAYLAGQTTYNAGAGNAVNLFNNEIRWYSGPAGGGGPWTNQFNIHRDNATFHMVVTAGNVDFNKLNLSDLLTNTSSSLLEGQVVVGASTATTTADLELHSLMSLAARAAPGTPPSGFGFFYVNSGDGSLHYKGHSGTDTMIAPG